ncbi:MAG: DUF6544 family protein [Bryobacteraceae bacterium]|nr:DUF6544 family protein [Bryobacteraceae bacterium]
MDFDLTMIQGLPDRVQRYFTHSIEVGAPLPRTVEIEMTGEMRLSRGGRWMPMRAHEILTPGSGFVFKAAVGKWLPIRGSDRYMDGKGAMEWRLLGMIPVARASGPDISRSALGRMVVESFLVPGSLLPRCGVQWQQLDPDHAEARFESGAHCFTVTVKLAAGGALEQVAINRWGNLETGNGGYEEIGFGGYLGEDRKFGPYTIPTRIAVGWRPDTDRYFEFFRAGITDARFQVGDSTQSGQAAAVCAP